MLPVQPALRRTVSLPKGRGETGRTGETKGFSMSGVSWVKTYSEEGRVMSSPPDQEKMP